MNQILLDIWSIIWPLFQLVAATVGPVLVAFIAKRAADLLKINSEVARAEFEKKLSDALHQAAKNALRLMATKMLTSDTADNSAQLTSLLTSNGDKLVEYVMKKNPEAVEYFNLSGDAVMDIIRAKAMDLFVRN